MVGLLEPFVDTIVLCTMTGLVIVVTGAWNDPNAGTGIQMTSAAFATVFDWFPTLLSAIATLFAISILVFIIIQLPPGDYLSTLIDEARSTNDPNAHGSPRPV